ncbi:hypothetical protein K439DRAFT_1268140, partial [Ramaria rubella]
LQIFTDGSGYKGHIGAAAVALHKDEHLQYCLSRETKHTVFEGELVGILLALQMIDKSPTAKTVLIALDNQSAI